MDRQSVPFALRARLGPEATGGLVDILGAAHREWREDVIAALTDRFEIRLVEETSKLRFEITHLGAELRQEMTQLGANLRQEMMQSTCVLRKEISSGRFELVTWCFVFWVGQVFAVAGVMAVMLRLFRP